MPPTSIDGTDITGATIDGTDVQEITVDGQTVFTSAPQINLPVAYSNLVAWYPFDSATYGGSNADDVTAILGGSGDDTAYDGAVSGATYQSSGGVTDISGGANSGAYEFDGSNDNIDLPNLGFSGSTDISVTFWVNIDDLNKDNAFFWFGNASPDQGFLINNRPSKFQVAFLFNDFNISPTFLTTNAWFHVGVTFDGSTNELNVYADGSFVASNTMGTPNWQDSDYSIAYLRDTNGRFTDGKMDDVRVYDTVLSSSQVSSIYTNTEP